MKQIRILQIVNELNMGGIQAFLMNLYRNIDRSKIQFDFLINDLPVGDFENEILALGGKIYRVTPRKKSVTRNKRDLLRFFSEHKEYKCVHFHCSNLSYIEPLVAAKKCGVPVRIMHSHSTNLPNRLVHKLLHRINKAKLKNIVTHYYACSDLAGKWLYGGTIGESNTIIIQNGIKTAEYKFDRQKREEYRKKLGVESKRVFGNVGRLCEAKNHDFLIDVFYALKKKLPDSKLVLVGDGELRSAVQDKISAMGLTDDVLMLGARRDVPAILQALDVVIMPSKWEGFPVSLIEEQAAGLPCYVSDSITRQAKINTNVSYLPLSAGAEQWAAAIFENAELQTRIENTDAVIKAGFDISNTIKILEEVYFGSFQI